MNDTAATWKNKNSQTKGQKERGTGQQYSQTTLSTFDLKEDAREITKRYKETKVYKDTFRVWQRLFLGTSEFKVNLCALALWLALHIFATQCWLALIRAKQLSTVAILLYRFLSRWCLKTFFTEYQPCNLLSLYIFFGWSGLLEILRWQHLSYAVPRDYLVSQTKVNLFFCKI